MGSIISFFEGVADTISTIIGFVVDFFGDLVYMIQLLGSFITNIPSYFSWLPGSVVSIVVLIFGLVVVYKILGREG